MRDGSVPTPLLLRFYAYRALVSEGFVYPIITVHALAQGLSLAGVGLAAGSFFAGTLVGEIPTGYLGDRLGRRKGLALGSGLVACTHLGFAVADSLAAFVALWGFWGVAATFRSGSTDAWLYDALADRGAAGAYTRIRGRATGVFYASAALSAIAGGVLYERWSALPFLAAAGLTGVGGLVVLSLPEPDATRADQGFSVAEARTALATVVTGRTVRRFVVLSGAALAVPEAVEVFVQPVALSVGFRPATLGPLYAGLMLAAAVGSAAADPVRRRIGADRWFLVGPLALAVVLVAATAAPVAALPAFLLGRGTNTVSGTLTSTFLNERIESRGRATVLSGISMVHALIFLLARAASGRAADATTPIVALAGLACLGVAVVVTVRGAADPFAAARSTPTE